MYVADIDKIKLELIKWISSLEDLDQLSMIESIRLSWEESMKESWNEVSDWEREQIELGVKDTEEGRVVSSAEFWKRLREGLQS